MTNTMRGYGTAFFAGVMLWLAGNNVTWLASHVTAFDQSAVTVFLVVVALLGIGAVSEYTSRVMPYVESFVVAIGLGVAGSGLLMPYTDSQTALTVAVNGAVAIILLQGGLEIKREDFRKLIGAVTMLGFLTLFITAIGLTFVALLIAQAMGIMMLPTVALLLGAILASTDPAALVPIFKKLQMMNKTAGVATIAESALTDVTGTILTIRLLGIVMSGTSMGFDWWSDGYAAVLTTESALAIGHEMLMGAVAGIAGYLGLLALERYLLSQEKPHGVDSVGVKFIGLLTFGFAYGIHGSGYLAVFVMGLLFTATGHHVVKKAEHGVNDYIDALLKPLVFATLGAIVNIQLLLENAALGIVVGLMFMFVVRPLAMFLTMTPFVFYSNWKRAKAERCGGVIDPVADISWKDVTFMAAVRETGAIPAALLITVSASGIPGGEQLVAVGMWVILLTLIIGPAYKPWLASKLKLTAV